MDLIYGIIGVIFFAGVAVWVVEWKRGKPFEPMGNAATTDPYMTGEIERAKEMFDPARSNRNAD